MAGRTLIILHRFTDPQNPPESPARKQHNYFSKYGPRVSAGTKYVVKPYSRNPNRPSFSSGLFFFFPTIKTTAKDRSNALTRRKTASLCRRTEWNVRSKSCWRTAKTKKATVKQIRSSLAKPGIKKINRFPLVVTCVPSPLVPPCCFRFSGIREVFTPLETRTLGAFFFFSLKLCAGDTVRNPKDTYESCVFDLLSSSLCARSKYYSFGCFFFLII